MSSRDHDNSSAGNEPGELGVPPVPPGLRAALNRYKQACKRRVQRECCIMSPMDENSWFATPTISQFVFNVNENQIVASPNPQRVGILFTTGLPGTVIVGSLIQAGPATITGTFAPDGSSVVEFINGLTFDAQLPFLQGGYYVFPTNTPSDAGALGIAGGGIYSNSLAGPLSFLQRDWGPLPAMGWVAGSTSAQVLRLNVMELILRDWPEDNG